MEKPVELDELKGQWQALDRKLERSIALNLQVLTETRMRRVKLRLLPLLLLQPLQVVIGVAIAASSGSFWTGHLDNPVMLISGLTLHASGIALIIDAVMRILLISRIKVAAPVVTIQRYLAYLRRWEIRSFKWGWMISWALLPAIFLVLPQAVAGVDLWARRPSFIAWTAVVSALVMLASYLFDLWARGRVDNFYVGHSVGAAQAALNEIEEFARE
jgi:hypothetical protein